MATLLSRQGFLTTFWQMNSPRQLNPLYRTMKVMDPALSRHLVSALAHCEQQAGNKKQNLAFEEVKIPVPWGHITGKWYGSKEATPLLALHGFEDNAGSFDRIAPLLNVPAFLSLDAPGHGKSSHFPSGMSYNFMDFVLNLRRVVLHYGWKRISILGHSFGGTMGLVYAALYPTEVNSLIILDSTTILMALRSRGLPLLRGMMEANIKSDNLSNDNAPAYTWEELISSYYKGNFNSVSRDHIDHIMKRGAVPHSKQENRYYFSRDPRLRLGDLSRPEIIALSDFASNLKCHLLQIFGNDGYVTLSASTNREVTELYLEEEALYKKAALSYERYDVPGTHHVHLNNPEIVAPFINQFLLKHFEKCSL